MALSRQLERGQYRDRPRRAGGGLSRDGAPRAAGPASGRGQRSPPSAGTGSSSGSCAQSSGNLASHGNQWPRSADRLRHAERQLGGREARLRGRGFRDASQLGGSAKTTYRCKKGRATAKFTPSKTQAARIPRLGGITAALTLVEKDKTEHLSVSVSKILPAPPYWTSNFGLSCAAEGSNVAQLVAPNFSASLPTTIDVRPWLAWYTPSTGWQWLGSRGPGKSSWYRWTATPSGVAEWQQNGTITTPWTWGPISVAPGHGTHLVAAFEAVYWYGNPAKVWNYAHSQPGSLSTDCVYP